jgi:hypothetical protein
MLLCGAALGAALVAGSAPAATFVVEGEALRIFGDIEPGDDAKFLALWGRGFSQLRVQSVGGDVQAALAIGEAIAKVQPLIVVDGLCMGTCASFIFLASPAHHVLREGLVCFEGAPASTESEIRALLRTAVRRGELIEEQVDATVAARMRPVKDIQPRLDALLQASGTDPKILHETELFIAREFVDDPDVSREEFLRDKQLYWCPVPEAFARYNVNGHWDWFPISDRGLYEYGRRMSSDWVLISRLKGRGETAR